MSHIWVPHETGVSQLNRAFVLKSMRHQTFDNVYNMSSKYNLSSVTSGNKYRDRVIVCTFYSR